MTEEKAKISRKEKILFYKATHPLLCPECENKTVPQLILEHRDSIPMLVKTKCEKCGYEGMLVEI